MANFSGTYAASAGSPQFYFDVSYSQTGRGSGTATYAVTVAARMASSSSYFAYPMDGTVYIGNTSQTINFKGTEGWSGTGSHSFTFNMTATNPGDGGGVLDARLVVTSGSSSAGKVDTGWQTVSCSAWNTAPYWPNGSVVTPNVSGIIPENTSTINLGWSSAGDAESGVYFTIWKELNYSGSWTTLTTNAPHRSYTDSIGSGNQGQVIRYRIEARDYQGLRSGYLYSPYITKNRFTSSQLSSSSSIAYATTSIPFTVTAASNTNGNTTFTYTLACNNLTVYNPTVAAGTVTLTIYKTGTLPTGPYIKFDDIKTLTKASGYKGTLQFTLTSTNAYGSSNTSAQNIAVDITTAPSTFASAVATSGVYTIGGSNYYIPNRKAIVATWGAVTDTLDATGAITYDVQVKLGSGSYSTVASNLVATTASFTLAAVSAATSCIVRVIAKTTYGTSRTIDLATAITLHYYNAPTIVYNEVIRNQTSAVVSGTIKCNSSITTLIVNTPVNYTTSGGKVTAATATTYTAASKTFTSTISALTDTTTFTYSLTAQDNAGIVIGTSATTATIKVGSYIPAIAIRSNGIGINAAPDGVNKLTIGGGLGVTGAITAASATITGNIKVGGVDATSTAGVVNSIVKRDSYGFIRSSYFNSNIDIQDTYKASSYFYEQTSKDGYLRKKSVAGVRAEVGGVPGQIAYFAMSAVPTGWLKANGAAVSRTTYAELFAAIGTNFGGGNGSTTFNLPDMRGLFARGWDDGAGIDPGRTLGSYQSGQLESHGGHVVNRPETGTHYINPSIATAFTRGAWIIEHGNEIQPARTNVGGTETRPANRALLACIKY